jgi:hypothetical protein
MDSPGAIDRRGSRAATAAVSLPAKYTLLRITRPVMTARHFIEYFLWVPDAPNAPSSWTLQWILAEVVGRDYEPIASERHLATAPGAAPPSAFEPHKYARVYVNGYGEAEWEILVPTLRRGVIPWRIPR